MKSPFLVGGLSLLIAGTLTRPALSADQPVYPLKVHVVSSELKNECSTDSKGSICSLYQLLTVTIEAKKYRLESSRLRQQILQPGDYQARVVKDEKKGSAEYVREYELIFADGKTVKYEVIGEFE